MTKTSARERSTLALRPLDAARSLGLQKRSIEGLLATGAIRCVRAGAAVLVPVAALDEYLGNKPETSSKPDGRLFYRRADVARMLSVSLRKLDGMLAAGVLRYRRDGRTVLVAKSDLNRFLKEGN